MASILTLRLIMTGVNTGKTGVWGDCKFVKGVHLMVGQPSEFEHRIAKMRFYNAFLDGTDELTKAIERDIANGNSYTYPISSVQSAGKAVGSPEGQVGSTVHSNESASSGASNGTGHDGAEQGKAGVLPTRTSTVGVTANQSDDKRIQDAKSKKIKDILLQLDHQNDEHWTQAGLPRLSVIEQALGETGILRADLEAVMPGFDRQKSDETETF